MQLSECKEGSVIIILENTSQCHAKGFRGIVVDRYPEDRVSGGTTVQFEGDGGRHTFVWNDENPKVTFEGMGKLEMKIIMDKPE